MRSRPVTAPYRAGIIAAVLLFTVLGCRSRTGDPPTAPQPAPIEESAPSVPDEPPPLEVLATEGHDGIRVMDIEFCEDVQLRTPVGLNHRFAAGGARRVWGYITFFNPKSRGGATARWTREGEVLKELRLAVNKNPRFRTWDSLPLASAAPGRYTLQIFDNTGRALARRAFYVLPPEAAAETAEEESTP